MWSISVADGELVARTAVLAVSAARTFLYEYSTPTPLTAAPR